MTRFAVYTRKKRIFPNRRSSDGTVPHWSSFHRKKGLISQVKTRRNKAENTTIFERRSFYEKHN